MLYSIRTLVKILLQKHFFLRPLGITVGYGEKVDSVYVNKCSGCYWSNSVKNVFSCDLGRVTILTVSNGEKCCEQLQWLLEQRLVQRLVEMIDSSQTSEVICGLYIVFRLYDTMPLHTSTLHVLAVTVLSDHLSVTLLSYYVMT